MSLEFTAKIICDNCRVRIVGKTSNRATRIAESYRDAKGTASKSGWVTVPRGRYRVAAHYCKGCADKPVAKIKDPPRKPKCRNCKGTGGVTKWNEGVGRRELCRVCGGTGKPKGVT